jgi:acyl-CoA thioester hydrolase
VRLSLTPSTDRADYGFAHRIRVRFAETDAMGVVHHGSYVLYLEDARVELLRHHGHPYGEVRAQGIEFPLVELFVQYRLPISFDEQVDVHVAVGQVTRTTFQIGYLLQVEGETRATAVTVHGAVGAMQRPTRLPTWIADLDEVRRRSAE